VRWQATLDWLAARKTSGRQQKPFLQNLLRLGLYQIFWLDRIPAHAAVNETVETARQSGFGPQSGFINAVLRGYLREADETRKLLEDLKISDPATGYSHPSWLVERWQLDGGNNERFAGKLPLFGGLDSARFRRQVEPGDVLELHVELQRMSARAGKGSGRAMLRGEKACECDLMFVLVDG
jgi:hypothetical protein